MNRTRQLTGQGRFGRVLLAVAGACAVLLLPYGLDLYLMHVVDVALVFTLLAIGLYLTLGISGQINLAQIAFFGVGAYTSAVLTTEFGLGFWVAAVVAVPAAGLTGLVVSIPALRVQSHYLAIVTLGLALAFTNLVTNTELTGRAEGIRNLPVPPFLFDLSSDYLFYYVEVAVLAVAVAAAAFVVRTRLGRRLRAMRDDTLAAASVGAEVGLQVRRKWTGTVAARPGLGVGGHRCRRGWPAPLCGAAGRVGWRWRP